MAHLPGHRPAVGKNQAAALVIVRICVGVFVFSLGVERAGWLLDSTALATQLSSWLPDAPPVSRWYLDRVIPGAPVFARVLPAGLMLGGLALALGFWTRTAAGLALLMVLNLQVAAGAMFRIAYLSDAGGLPVVGALIALIIAGGTLPFSVRR